MAEQFSNFARTTLASTITSTDTTITVSDGSKFPLVNFTITIENEIVLIASRSSNTFTVASGGRNYTGSVGGAVSHISGTTVLHGALKHHFDELYSMSQPNVGAKIYRAAAAATLATGANAQIAFDTAAYDTDNMWSSSTPNRLTARRAGRYLFEATVSFSAHATGRRAVSALVNGISVIGTNQAQAVTSGVETTVTTSTVLNLGVGDYVEVVPYQDSGTTLTLLVSGQNHPSMSLMMLSGGAQPNSPSAAVRRTTTQSIVTGWQDITFDAVRWDTDLMWAVGTPTRLTVKTAGRYVIDGSLYFSNAQTGLRFLAIAINGAQQTLVGPQSTNATHGLNLSVAHVADLKVGDYITLQVFTDTNTTVGSSDTITYPYACKLHATMAPGGLARNTAPPAAVAARMTKTNTQALTAGTWTTATWNGVDFDTDGMASTSTGAMTVRSNGKYLINARVNFAASATNPQRRIIGIWKGPVNVGGSVELGRTDHLYPNNGSDTTDMSVVQVADLKAGDVIYIGIWSAGSHNAGSASLWENTFEVVLLSGNTIPVTSHARVQRTGASTIPHNIDQVVTFDAVREDSDTMWSSAQPTRLTIKTAGKYIFTATAGFAVNGTGVRQASIVVNGLAAQHQVATQMIPANSSYTAEINLSGVMDMKVGDYVELWLFQNSGSTLSLPVTVDRSTILTATLAAPGVRVGQDSSPRNVAARVSRGSGSISVSAATWTKLTWDTTTFDTDGMADLVNERLVCRTPGKYVMTASTEWAPQASGRKIVSIWKNGLSGVEVARTDQILGDGSNTICQSVVAMVDLAYGDYVETWVYSAAATTVQTNLPHYGDHFEVALVSGVANPTAPSARVSKSGNSVGNSGSAAMASFTTENFDTDNMWDSSAPTRLTCRTAGKYMLTGAAGNWQNNATGMRWIGIAVNGAYVVTDSRPVRADGYSDLSTSTVVDLKIGDYVELGVAHTGSVTLTNDATLSAVMAAPFGQQTAATASMPQGVLGYAQITSNQNGITTEVDLTGLSVTVNVAAGRRIKITASGGWTPTNTNGAQIAINIKEGSTYLRGGDYLGGQAGNGLNWENTLILTPTAGSHTYKMSAQITVGAGAVQILASTTRPNFILVEDIGSA